MDKDLQPETKTTIWITAIGSIFLTYWVYSIVTCTGSQEDLDEITIRNAITTATSVQ